MVKLIDEVIKTKEKLDSVLKEIADIHYPEWTGVIYNLKELTITEQIKEWNHGELVKEGGD